MNKSSARRMSPSTPDQDMCAVWEDEWLSFDKAAKVEVVLGGNSVQLRLRDGGRGFGMN